MVYIHKVSSSTAKFPETRKVSLFLILFRWIAFGVVFLFLYQEPKQAELRNFYLLTSLTFFYTILISYFYGKGLQNPNISTKILVTVDTLYCGFLIWFTGGLNSPFFLYAFSPILTAAFFFKVTGGLTTASTISLLYLASLAANNYSLAKIIEDRQVGDLAFDILAFFLIGVFFAYPSSLLDRLLSTVNNLIKKNDKLVDVNRVFARTNQQLFALQKMSTALHSSMDLNEILDIILTVTIEIGFDGVALGLCDEENRVLSNWIAADRHHKESAGGLKDFEIPLSEEGGLVAKSVISKKPFVVSPNGNSGKILPSHLKNSFFAVLPMTFEGRIVGVMLIDNHLSKKPVSETDIPILKSVASLAAVAIESARLVIRNQMLVVAEERNRIAREIHDGLAQSLFSIAINLQTCAKKMGDDPFETKEKLVQLQKLASTSLKELRQYIYNLPFNNLVNTDLTTALKSYTNDVARLNGLEANFSVVGMPRCLPSEVEECLYRVGQEALANVVKHAKASKVEVRLEFRNGNVSLMVADNGQGFNGHKTNESMGIHNMRQRIESLGGVFNLISNKGYGVCASAELPVKG